MFVLKNRVKTDKHKLVTNDYPFFLQNSPKKFMCMSRRYTSETHQVTTTAIRSEQVCNYDLDDMDLRLVFFLSNSNKKANDPLGRTIQPLYFLFWLLLRSLLY